MTTKEIVDILIVDDDPNTLFALEAILADPTYNLIKASSGEDTLRYLLKNEVAVILLDVQMSGIDGFETATIIRKRAKLRRTPIIFTTGVHIDTKDIFKGYSVGAVDYLLKPLDPDIIRAKVAVFADLYRKKQQLKRDASKQKRAEEENEEIFLETINVSPIVAEAIKEEAAKVFETDFFKSLKKQLELERIANDI